MLPRPTRRTLGLGLWAGGEAGAAEVGVVEARAGPSEKTAGDATAALPRRTREAVAVDGASRVRQHGRCGVVRAVAGRIEAAAERCVGVAHRCQRTPLEPVTSDGHT
eukprot:7381901-Prymnesium_polylepis.2